VRESQDIILSRVVAESNRQDELPESLVTVLYGMGQVAQAQTCGMLAPVAHAQMCGMLRPIQFLP
jgi:hypothetical protein